MSAAFSFLLLLFYFLRPIGAAASCPTSKFICGITTLDIEYPFFTNTTSPVCGGLYLIHCLNLTPMIQFPGQEFLYPVKNISYTDRSLIIHDLKLSLSPYPWGPDCVFLYLFATPIPGFNVTQLSLLLSSGHFHFDCRMSVFVSDVLDEIYHTPVCKDYTLHYTYQVDSQPSAGLPANCSTSGPFWFGWKLSFGQGGGDGSGLSLVSAGFSRSWEFQLDCFDCQIAVRDCNDGGGANSECRGSNSKKNNNIIIAAASAAAVGFVLAGALGFLCYRHKKRRQPITASTPLFRDSSFKSSFTEDPEFGKGDYQTHIFSYHELQEATDHFNAAQELGDGGYGTVYKGKLRDGRTVAVKRLYDSNFKRVEQFINEVAILSRLRHQNLVNLYGCTSRKSRELLLVYEFVSNGTVADHIHGPRAAEGALSWPRRISIAVETAEALAYLHAVEPPIIHRDVKTNNILLDDGFHVKVADFGLSRLVPTDATHVSTAPQGTPGYLDPEYYQCYQLTDKSDVYSFGVVLVELISSKQAVDVSRDRNEINLATMAVNRIQKRELEELVDPGLGYESDWEMRRVITVVAELAFRCLQMDRDMRPPIKEVVEVLRAVQSGAYKSGEDDVGARDDVGLLKNTGLFSPDTVTEKWASRSTTPNSSG